MYCKSEWTHTHTRTRTRTRTHTHTHSHAHTHTHHSHAHAHTHTHTLDINIVELSPSYKYTHYRYGEEFIQEAYLYHITRRDIKHNFSVFFYLLYLIQGSWLSLPVGLLAFFPQASLVVVAAVRLHKDIVFCCFVQTFVFVTFNKVCTSQVLCVCVCVHVCACVCACVRVCVCVCY